MRLNTEDLIGLVERHKECLSLEIMEPLFKAQKGDCTNVADCVLMYLLILDNDPRHIVEFSPMLGYSTRYLATAMKILGRSGSMFTVDCEAGYAESTRKRLKKMGLKDYCQVIRGDGISVTREEVLRRVWEVEFIFIDSNHSYQFGKRYIKEVFPVLSEGCIVMVHDICGQSVETKPHGRDFTTSLRSTDNKFAEYRAIKEFLIEQNIEHTLTHPLLGGWWQWCSWRSSGLESSPKLPENTEFYRAYYETVGYDLNDYRNFQHPNGLLFKL